MDALIMCGGHGSRLRNQQNTTTDDEIHSPDELRHIETDKNRSCADSSVTQQSTPASNRSVIEREKPLVEIDGTTMLSHVVDALTASPVETVWAVTSPNAPRTATTVRESSSFESISPIETAGDGYVPDLQHALSVVDTPVVTTPADLPLLSSDHITEIITAARMPGDARATPTLSSTMLCVPAALKQQLGVSIDTVFEHKDLTVTPSGVNVVGEDTDTVCVSYDARLAVNVNRPTDRHIAEKLCE